MLAGHDYSDGYSYSNYRFGVKRAVDDFVRAEGLPPPLYTLKDGESPTWYLLKCPYFAMPHHFGRTEDPTKWEEAPFYHKVGWVDSVVPSGSSWC
mmetsp:Transcript_34960/g.79712  ORF Transcript_34960/g.79712 Transcript_34960/m.79712 type:complete len:95 (-) Transcript_34960:123-407(-)